MQNKGRVLGQRLGQKVGERVFCKCFVKCGGRGGAEESGREYPTPRPGRPETPLAWSRKVGAAVGEKPLQVLVFCGSGGPLDCAAGWPMWGDMLAMVCSGAVFEESW